MVHTLYQAPTGSYRSPQSPDLCEDKPPVDAFELHHILQQFVDSPRLLELRRDRRLLKYRELSAYLAQTPTPNPTPPRPVRLRLICQPRESSDDPRFQRLRLTAPKKPQGVTKKTGMGGGNAAKTGLKIRLDLRKVREWWLQGLEQEEQASADRRTLRHGEVEGLASVLGLA